MAMGQTDPDTQMTAGRGEDTDPEVPERGEQRKRIIGAH